MADLAAQYAFDAFSIILVNVLLSGDNALVIAMAVKALPPETRKLGIVIGSGGAAVLRIGLTFFTGELLGLKYVQLVGGLAILWIAVKLLTEGVQDTPAHARPVSLWHAVRVVLVADVTMSTDNILAIAAIAKDNVWLLAFGLGVSIAFVVFTSAILATLMDRYPALLYIGAAILGRVGGSMIVSDPWIRTTVHPSMSAGIAIQVALAAAVLIIGRALARQALLSTNNT